MEANFHRETPIPVTFLTSYCLFTVTGALFHLRDGPILESDNIFSVPLCKTFVYSTR
jgi:hypothetical protein